MNYEVVFIGCVVFLVVFRFVADSKLVKNSTRTNNTAMNIGAAVAFVTMAIPALWAIGWLLYWWEVSDMNSDKSDDCPVGQYRRVASQRQPGGDLEEWVECRRNPIRPEPLWPILNSKK